MDNILLELSDDFFLPEVRNDCYISAERKKIWAVELDLLNKFFSVCNEYDIKAFAISGTLLGAVRHQGFIPWDDDVDICMTRENYNKLEKIADTAFKTPYFFQTARNDKRFFSSTPRLRNSNTTGIVAWNYSSKYNNGIFLDCFIMDAVPQNDLFFKVQRKKLLWMQAILKMYKPDTSLRQQIERGNHKKLKAIIKRMIKYEFLLNIYDKISQQYNGRSEILAFTNTAVFSHKYRCRSEDLRGDQRIRFENIEIPIPKNSERILKEIYGDYMRLPLVEEREEYHSGRIIFDAEMPYLDFFNKHKDMRILWDESKGKQVKVNRYENKV